MQLQGTLSLWNDKRGFGFVDPDGGGVRAFVHISAFDQTDSRPQVGDRLSYRLGRDQLGRAVARHVRLTEAQARQRAPRGRPNAWAQALLLGLAGLLGTGLLLGRFPLWLPMAYLLVSLITYLCYARDKWAARTGHWRTRERTLHLLSLLGGWPGALLAQQRLRHKTRKRSFLLPFSLSVATHLGGLFYLLVNPQSQYWLRRLLVG